MRGAGLVADSSYLRQVVQGFRIPEADPTMNNNETIFDKFSFKAFSDNLQGLANCILFCLMTPKIRYMVQSALRKVCCGCWCFWRDRRRRRLLEESFNASASRPRIYKISRGAVETTPPANDQGKKKARKGKKLYEPFQTDDEWDCS